MEKGGVGVHLVVLGKALEGEREKCHFPMLPFQHALPAAFTTKEIVPSYETRHWADMKKCNAYIRPHFDGTYAVCDNDN